MSTINVSGTSEPHRERAPLWQWWPLLLGPLAIAAVCVLEVSDRPEFHAKETQEVAAIVLPSLALLITLVRLTIWREPYRLILLALCVTVLLREIHWDWTTRGVFVLIALVGVWAFVWRRHLVFYVDSHPRVRIWLIATLLTYILSQLVARKVAQHLLPEGTPVFLFIEQIYDRVEEVVENTAHLMLVICASIGPRQHVILQRWRQVVTH